MLETNINETHSFLRMTCLLLNKKLALMEDKNNNLNHKLKNLESYTITKQAIKDAIKEELAPIINILIGKEKEVAHIQTQTDNVIIEYSKNKIKSISEVVQS